MKKLLFALSAMALLGLATACVDPVEQNPNYDPITNSVTTQFVLNISAAENPETKQMASTPQIGGSFRGIENATLFAFSQTNDGRKLLSPTTATTTFDLSAALSAGSITDDSSRRIIDLSLPVGTNTLVFYGMASKNGKNSDEVGKLEYIYPDKNLAHIGSFAVPRLDPRTLESDYFDDIEDIILKTWNYFLKVGINGNYGWDNTAVTSVSAPNLTGSLSLTGKAIHWVDYTKAINDDGTAAISPLCSYLSLPSQQASPTEQQLGLLYNKLTTINTSKNELRAADGASLEREAIDIYKSLKKLAYNSNDSDTFPISLLDMVAKEVVSALLGHIEKFCDVSSLQWKPIGTIVSTLNNMNITTPTFSGGNSYTLRDFPAQFGLPVGSTTWTLVQSDTDPVTLVDGNTVIKDAFTYTSSSGFNIPTATGTTGTAIKVQDFVYPPELCYYGNSPLRINSSTTLTSENYPNGTANWIDDNKWAGWAKNHHVESNTRGVAMINNIQYGMAVLVSQVRINATDNKLYDNFKALHDTTRDKDNELTVTNTSFTLTGILIGGQPSCVNWLYLPWEGYQWQGATADPAHEDYPEQTFNNHKVIYDKNMNVRTQNENTFSASVVPVGESYSEPNYTIVFDNIADKDNNYTTQNPVYVALEFVNKTGKDFWGHANVIRNEGTFYLLAKLNPPTYSELFWPASYNDMMPPYKEDGTSYKIPRVFMSDHKTIANFTIGPKSLQHAFVTVPDLRASQMSLGLSVDLQWVSGGVYNIVFDGGNTQQ